MSQHFEIPFKSARELDDAALLLRWQAGASSAGSELVRRYHGRIARYFRRRFHGEVADLVQRTWLIVLETRRRLVHAERFQSYCIGIARNVAREEIRRRARRMPAAEELGLVREQPSPADLIERADVLERLEGAVGELPRGLADVLLLTYWEQQTSVAISRGLGIPENTARSRLRRARALVRGRVLA